MTRAPTSDERLLFADDVERRALMRERAKKLAPNDRPRTTSGDAGERDEARTTDAPKRA